MINLNNIKNILKNISGRATKKEYDVNEVIPNLWLGNCKAVCNKEFLKKYNIKYVLTIMDNFDNNCRVDSVTYLNIPIKDSFACGKNFINLFEYTNEFINNGLKKNVGVLVHCKRGHHRSASLVVAYLIKNINLGYEDSIAYIRYLRPFALRRKTCMTDQLNNYYLSLKK